MLACLMCSFPSHAATWIKLHDNAYSKLLLDKQSIVTQAPLKKVWVKVEYKTPQKNPDSVDKVYNLSKALWHFDCDKKTSATTQVFQYLNQELVYSTSVDMKSVEFIEPMPESDLETAMVYVCKSQSSTPVAKPVTQAVPPASVSSNNLPAATVVPPASAQVEQNKENTPPQTNTAVAEKATPDVKTSKAKSATSNKASNTSSNQDWDYQGKNGPTLWGELNPNYASCSSGVNQSPVAFDTTIHAALKPIRTIHKFPAKEIELIHRGLRIHFKEGNMMVLDKNAFQLKHIDFHTPSEHQLNGQSYPLEIQLFHQDNKKNVAITSVLFQNGEPHAEIAELISELPKKMGELIKLKTRFTPNEVMPTNNRYYRYSGSLTTPPCSEGIRWVIMKSPLQASSEQIAAISKVIGTANNRPIQPLNGRTVLE
jgi:carbonic anhydrase